MRKAIAYAKDHAGQNSAAPGAGDAPVEAAASEPAGDKKNPIIVYAVNDDDVRRNMVEFMVQRPYDIDIRDSAASALHEAQLLREEGRSVVLMTNARNNVNPAALNDFAANNPAIPVIINTGIPTLTQEDVPHTMLLSQPYTVAELHNAMDSAVQRAQGKSFAAGEIKSVSAVDMAKNARKQGELGRE